MNRSSKIRSNKTRNIKGQVIVEYMLLLIVAVGFAILVTKLLVSRNPDDAGVVVKKWHEILNSIAKDVPDEHKP